MHKQKIIFLKKISVDKGMVKVVKWLNSFQETCTIYSCEGDDLPGSANKPYVMFYCPHQLCLMRILSFVDNFALCEVDFYNKNLRYTLRFHSKNELKNFKRKIKISLNSGEEL